MDEEKSKQDLRRLVGEILPYHVGVPREERQSEAFLNAIAEASSILARFSELERSKPSSSSLPTKTVDEAQIILTRMRDFELITSSSSTYPEVPKAFICPLSDRIMVEPVILSCGHTFEKRYVTELTKHSRNCPVDNQILSNRLLIPNRSLYSLIRDWVQQNGSISPHRVSGRAFLESKRGYQVVPNQVDVPVPTQASEMILAAHEENPLPAHQDEEMPPAHEENPAHQDDEIPPPAEEIPPQANQGAWGAFFDMLDRNRKILGRQVHPIEDEGLHFPDLAANIYARFTADGDRVP